jgi:Protein of unknown function (DUF1269)
MPLANPGRRRSHVATTDRQIVAATFATPDGGSRGAGAVGGAFPDKIGNAAVLHVKPDGTPKFVESKDWGAGRGALVGGAIGIIGGPVGIAAGAGIGALAAKLRDSGFENDQLERLGRSLTPNSSAAVLEIAGDAVPTAEQLLKALGSQELVAVPVDSNVADLFSGEQTPLPEADPEAVPSITSSATSSS